MKFSIEDFFSKCDQIRNFLWIWSHLLKKSLMENFIFNAVKKYLPFIKTIDLGILTSALLMRPSDPLHCVKSVLIWSFSGPYFTAFRLNMESCSVSPYSVRMRENTDQKNSEYGHYARSVNHVLNNPIFHTITGKNFSSTIAKSPTFTVDKLSLD